MIDFLYRIRHKPTGLFYDRVRGRFTGDKTNLTNKGKFYFSEKMAQKTLSEFGRAYINKTQVEKYNLERKEEDYYDRSHSFATEDEFEIVKYKLEEVR